MSSELANLIETLGEAGSLKLIETFGGTRVVVPAKRPETHKLLDVLGPDVFRLFWEKYRGEVFHVPIARAWRIDIYARQKMSRAEIARRAGCSENTVYAHLRGDRRSPAGQLALSFEK